MLFLHGRKKRTHQLLTVENEDAAIKILPSCGRQHLPIMRPITPQATHSAGQYCDCIKIMDGLQTIVSIVNSARIIQSALVFFCLYFPAAQICCDVNVGFSFLKTFLLPHNLELPHISALCSSGGATNTGCINSCALGISLHKTILINIPGTAQQNCALCKKCILALLDQEFWLSVQTFSSHVGCSPLRLTC